MVTIKTSMGDIKLELFEEEAPETVKNFLSYVDDGHYSNTIFHRVINNFMVQGGGFDTSFTQLPTKAPVKNEANNMLSNKRGTVAMARTAVVDSATSQFFINLSDNKALDFTAPHPMSFGYCVFGRVIKGMDIVDKIAAVKTTARAGMKFVPAKNIIIKSITIQKSSKK